MKKNVMRFDEPRQDLIAIAKRIASRNDEDDVEFFAPAIRTRMIAALPPRDRADAVSHGDRWICERYLKTQETNR